uniref:Uncharacterized protein n=1 Tax=viral metagenome TaxID=1070528 RepID=A0A6M3IP58_9ZZZZ
MKCDSCIHIIVEPPTMDSPYGEYACGKGHWEGGPIPDETIKEDPWKYCKDYKEDT